MRKAVFDLAHQVFKKLEKLGDLKILLVLRDSITASVPVLGAGTILFFFLFPHPGLGDRFMKAFLGGLGLMAFGVSAALPWKGAEGTKALKGLRSGLSVLLFVLTLLPADGWIQSGLEGLFLYLSRAGLFVAIILSLLFLGGEALIARLWKTGSPFPGILMTTGILAGILLFLFLQGISVHDVANFLVKPLLRAGDSLPWVLLILLVMSSLWLAGLHGAGIVGGIITPIYVAALQTNVAAHSLHEPTGSFWAEAGGLLPFPISCCSPDPENSVNWAV
ncbi:MAG: hypothetical protein HYU64_19200 [Armatimonadetes bacterium]|nr:hypothetical protein [Armatimonadota bacterium]